MTPKQHLIQLAMERKQAKNPNFPYPPKPKYTDTTANGLTKMIIDFINLSGGQAERISNTGRVVIEKGVKDQVFNRSFASVKWIPGQGTNGTADIRAVIKGRSVSIEVKIGRDRMSTAQHEYKARVEAAGGIYLIAKNFNDIYKDLLPLL